MFQLLNKNTFKSFYKSIFIFFVPIFLVVIIPVKSNGQTAKQLRTLFEKKVFKDGIIINEDSKMVNGSKFYSAQVKYKYRSSSTFISQVNNFVSSYSDLSYLRTFRKRENGEGIHADIITDTDDDGGYYLMGINFVERESESIGQVYVGYSPKK